MSPSNLFLCDEKELEPLTSPAVAIGNFDGIHRGHQEIFKTLRAYAAEHDVSAVALTFEPHPIFFFQPDAAPYCLQTLEEKRRVASELIDALVPVNFAAIAGWSPRKFFIKVLVEGLHASCVMVGHNFRFGKGRQGDVSTLQELCDEFDLTLIVIDDVMTGPGDGAAAERAPHMISSTEVRRYLLDANLTKVAELLGRPWELTGEVVHGDAIGQSMGFPTANIETSASRILPPAGIYATYLIVADQRYQAASYIGTRPTIKGASCNDLRIESFVLDAPEGFSIYAANVRLQFIAFIRPDCAFETLDALAVQMTEDVAACREALRTFHETYHGT